MKRIISVLLVILVICSFSVDSFAIDIESENKLIEAVENKQSSVVINKNISINDFVREFVDRNPELFYFNPTGSAYWDNGKIDIAYYDWSDEKIRAFNEKVNEIVLSALNIEKDIDKVMYVHEYIMEHSEYNFDFTGFTAYDNLIDGKSVCEGYTKAFVCIMHKLGIECAMVTSELNKHAWNLVKLDGKWYYLDITHDDLMGKYHNYLLISGENLVDDGHLVAKDGNGVYHDWMFNSVVDCTKVYNNKEYDNAYWKKAVNIMNYDNGIWYYTDGLDIYKCGVGMKEVKIAKHNPDDYIWFVPNENKYYSGHYSDVVLCSDRLYYSTASTVRSMKKDGTDDRLEFSLSAKESQKGYIYDLRVIDNEVYYYLSAAPRKEVLASGKIKKMKDSHNHKMGEWFVIEEPTVDEFGIKMRKCLVAGCEYCESVSVEKIHKHNMSEWGVVVLPTEKDSGLEVRKCIDCGYTESRVVPKISGEDLLGDVNFDGKVNTKDARLILQGSAKLVPLNDRQNKVADVNKDGKVNTKDARKILRVAAKLEVI